MNLKPYKPIVHEPHTVKFPFLERNTYLIVMFILVLSVGVAYYIWG